MGVSKASKILKPMVKGMDNQPVSKVRWIKRELLHANGYNPNHVFPPEIELLKISIMADGWTQPIVIRSDGEIVDGFHRWTISADPEIGAMTDGYVPTVQIPDNVPMEHQKMSTIRHNRARGSHAVLRMADIVISLIDDHGLSPKQVQELLQMEEEEVSRLYDRGNMRKRGSKEGFSQSWNPQREKGR